MATAAAVLRHGNEGNSNYESGYGVERPRVASPDVRAFPNEDIYFWRKTVDNSRVARQSDPRIWERGWQFITLAGVGVVVLVGLSLPAAINLLWGAQLERLRFENEQLQSDQRELKAEQSKLLGPSRLEQLAGQLQMRNAEPSKVFDLRHDRQTAAARNQGPRSSGR